jgi:hypothetical protein
VRHGTQFNIIHPGSGLKVDVMVPRPSDFNQSRFSRVRRVAAGDDWTATSSSPEDAVLKKLEYFREGGSEKHLRDIAGVIGTMRQELDFGYCVFRPSRATVPVQGGRCSGACRAGVKR